MFMNWPLANGLSPALVGVTSFQWTPPSVVCKIKETAAASIIAEIGTDMTLFTSDKHLASWAGLCPGNKQSGGKRLSGKMTKGNPYLRAILFEVAWAIAHIKDNYLSAFYHRMARRHGSQLF
jgi:transposase